MIGHMTSASRTAVIYARISEKEDGVDKVANQVDRLRGLAQREGYEVVGIFADDDVSAYKGKKVRPQFRSMLARIKAGGVGVVLATEPQRLTRGSASDLEALNVVCAGAGTKVHTLSDGVQDPSTPNSAFLMGIMDLVGGLEVAQKTYRQVLRNEAETNAGMPLWGRRPFGFDGVEVENRHGGKSHRWTEHKSDEADAIRWAVDYFVKPEGTIYGVMQEWNARGLRTTAEGYKRRADGPKFTGDWTYASVRAVLRNPRIAGLLVRHGVVQDVVAAWEPIVSREDWQAVQDKLNDPKRRTNPGRKPHSLGSGLVLCVCGLPMRATTIKGIPRDAEGASRVVQKVSGLRCDVTRALAQGRNSEGSQHVSVRDDDVNPLIVDAVASAFTFGPLNMIPGGTVDTSPIDAELSKLRAARGRLVSLVAQDLVSESDASSELRTIKLREADLENQRAEAVSTSAHAAMVVDLRASLWGKGKRVAFGDVATVKAALRERFESLPLTQRRELVRTLLDVRVLPGKGVKADPARRIVITHKVVTSLNQEDADPYEGV